MCADNYGLTEEYKEKKCEADCVGDESLICRRTFAILSFKECLEDELWLQTCTMSNCSKSITPELYENVENQGWHGLKCDERDCEDGCLEDQVCQKEMVGVMKIHECKYITQDHKITVPLNATSEPKANHAGVEYDNAEKEDEKEERENGKEKVISIETQKVGSDIDHRDECMKGFEIGKDQECQDIDECLKKTHNCDSEQQCGNIEGSYTCRYPVKEVENVMSKKNWFFLLLVIPLVAFIFFYALRSYRILQNQ